LNNQEGSPASDKPAKAPNENWVFRGIRKIERYFQERSASKKKETPQDRAARRTANATWWIAGFTLVSVGVGISQAIIANRTLVAISGQLAEMQSSSEQVERSIKASNRIADESKAANALTGEANRPWIGAVTVTVVPPIFDMKDSIVSVTLSNSGKSPAYVVQTRCAAGVQTVSPTNPQYPLNAIQTAIGSKSIVVPGQQFTCPLRKQAIPSQELARVKLSAGPYTFYIYGEIIYRDIATQSEHMTHVCWSYNASVDAYVFCPTYNSAD
jgi:enamine deaminase RidA (YjgF/YER057c/UK114 family)